MISSNQIETLLIISHLKNWWCGSYMFLIIYFTTHRKDLKIPILDLMPIVDLVFSKNFFPKICLTNNTAKEQPVSAEKDSQYQFLKDNNFIPVSGWKNLPEPPASYMTADAKQKMWHNRTVSNLVLKKTYNLIISVKDTW